MAHAVAPSAPEGRLTTYRRRPLHRHGAEKDRGAVPHTVTRKKVQVPVERIPQGTEIEQAADRGSADDPSALQRFARNRAERARKERVTKGRS